MAMTKKEMKQDIDNKTKCMIDSYALVLANVEKMFEDAEFSVEQVEIVKRADMFWNIALQRVDRDETEIKRQTELMELEKIQEANFAKQNNMMSVKPQIKTKSPCQQRADDDAKLIAELKAGAEAIIEMNK